MGAATRASVAAGVRALDGLRSPDAALGDELLAAARALGSSTQLVNVLADPGVPDEQRAALSDRVFAASGEQTRTVLRALATGRWSASRDLVAAVEELGYRAIAASPAADGLESELYSTMRAISSEGRLELAIGSTAAPVEARLALVDRLLADAKPATRSIVRHVVQAPRGRKPVEALESAQRIAAAARDRLVAVVQTASPLTDAQAKALGDRLEASYGRKIALDQTVDPTLLGGVRITIGDDVIDGTVRARLDDLRLRIAG